MYRPILLSLFFYLSAFGLDIRLSDAKANQERYSVVNISNSTPFLCQVQLDPYGTPKELVCAFNERPVPPFQKLKSDFFTIVPKEIDGNFFLILHAKYKLYAKPIIFNLTQDDELFKEHTSTARHWVVVGYQNEMPLIKPTKVKENSIDFPFYNDHEELPYVGGLDLNGNPVHIEDSADVRAFVEVKRLFSLKRYDDCIDTVDNVLRYYPKTLFASELLYYKIKSLFKLRAYDTVIELAKEYLHNYSSSENVPEVLLMIAVSYYKNGQYSDADYFFDRLFHEHADSVFSDWGYIYKGDMAADAGENSQAERFYKKALQKTKNIEVAATAAFKLAKLYAEEGKYSQATYYIDKILHAKDDFFYRHYQDSKRLMHTLADAQQYLTAAKIDEAILKYMKKSEEDYEANLRFLGLWYAKTKEKKKALEALERYIKEYSDGLYIDEIEKARDALFFDTKEANSADLLKKYDALIKRYGNDPIGQRAMYEKVKLMLKKRMYSDVLQLKDKIEALDSELYPDKEELVRQAALGLMQSALKNDQCQVVLDVQKSYDLNVSEKWDFDLYECFIKAGDFNKAKEIAKKHLKDKDLELKKEWLYRYAEVDFKTGNYSEAISAANDLLSLIENIKKSPYKKVYRILFDAYEHLGNYDKMIETIEKIIELYGIRYEDIDRYVAMVNAGIEKKDDNIVIKFGKMVYDLQQKSGKRIYSPFIEFSLYQAYMNKGEYQKALAVIESLDSVTLTAKERARQLYLKGVVLDKLWKNDAAKKAYEEAIKASPDSAWAKLAKSALEIE